MLHNDKAMIMLEETEDAEGNPNSREITINMADFLQSTNCGGLVFAVNNCLRNCFEVLEGFRIAQPYAVSLCSRRSKMQC